MQRRISIVLSLMLVAAAAICQTDDIVEVTFLQMNDVYEITPVEGGKYGGMARVATIRKELARENPNTYMVLAGDFISPSAMGTSVYDGKRINGIHMIDALNSVGVDFVTFGNHEFDLGYEALQRCIDRSRFTWISSNIAYTPSVEGYVKAFEKNVDGRSEPFPEWYIIRAKNASGTELKIGVIGLTIGSNKPAYVVWSDPLESAQRVYNEMKGQVDIAIAITHLSIEQDKKLATLLPALRFILGGHEHTNMMFKVGETIISKADANARTVFIHRLRWSSVRQSLAVTSEVKTVDATVADDSATAGVVREWSSRAYSGFREKGFDPERVVATLREPLDGRESSIRFRQTNLGALICSAMIAAAKQSRVALFNSGSIRLDDELAGTITEYDVIRTLPFGGKIVEVKMKGSLLQRVLNAGMQNAGIGGYLQYAGITSRMKSEHGKPPVTEWWIEGKPLRTKRTYAVVVSDYLFSGREQGLDFFSRANREVVSISEPDGNDSSDVRRDIRLAVIRHLKNESTRPR